MIRHYGCVIVGVGILATSIGQGAMISLSIFLQLISRTMGWSRAEISAAAFLSWMLSLASFASLGGRIVCGLIADRVGAKQTLLVGLALQAASVSLYVFTQSLASFYMLALLFGFAYGGVLPLYAILLREYFGGRIIGTALGAVAAVSTLGMALGPWAGGRLYDTFGSYFWLFIESFGIGLGAAAIAITFRPPRALPAALPSPGVAG